MPPAGFICVLLHIFIGYSYVRLPDIPFELMPKEGYRPSDLFVRVRSPLPDENIDKTFMEIFTNPELYKAIVEQYNYKKFPSEEGLAVVMYRNYRVAEKASIFAAKIFLTSAEELGYLKGEDGILRVNDHLHSSQEVEPVEPNKVDAVPNQLIYLPATDVKLKNDETEFEIIPFFLDNGAVAKLYMPRGSKPTDFKRICKVLTGYSD